MHSSASLPGGGWCSVNHSKPNKSNFQHTGHLTLFYYFKNKKERTTHLTCCFIRFALCSFAIRCALSNQLLIIRGTGSHLTQKVSPVWGAWACNPCIPLHVRFFFFLETVLDVLCPPRFCLLKSVCLSRSRLFVPGHSFPLYSSLDDACWLAV